MRKKERTEFQAAWVKPPPEEVVDRVYEMVLRLALARYEKEYDPFLVLWRKGTEDAQKAKSPRR